MPVGRSQKKFRPGDLAPITGIYVVIHGSPHRNPHEVVIIRGEPLPTCRTCKVDLSFEIVRAMSHVTHDWDFSGPHNLVVQPRHEEFADFRVFRRINIRLPITLELPPFARPVIVHGSSCDLSAGGMGAIIREKLSSRCKTAIVKIEVEADAAPLTLRARFRHQSGLRYGLEFISVDTSEREAIRQLIERHQKALTAGVA